MLGQFQVHLFSADCSLTEIKIPDLEPKLQNLTARGRVGKHVSFWPRWFRPCVQELTLKTLAIPCSSCMAHQSGRDPEDMQTAFNSFHQQMRA